MDSYKISKIYIIGVLCITTLCGCAHKQKPLTDVVPPSPPKEVAVTAPLLPSTDDLKDKISAIFNKTSLTPLFLQDLNNILLRTPTPTVAIESLQKQLENNPQAFPLIENLTLRFDVKSSFSQNSYPITIETPPQIGDSLQLLVVLDQYYEYPNPFEKLPYIKLYLPPKDKLSYQLWSQQDFKQLIEEIGSIIPKLKEKPIYMMASKDASLGALHLANAFPRKFQALALSPTTTQCDFPNLDQMNIVCFSLGNTQGEKENVTAFSERLTQRGNTHVQLIHGNIQDIFAALTKASNDVLLPLTYIDNYDQAQISPWLRIIKKQYELDKASISGNIETTTLVLTSRNISQIEINQDWIHQNYPQITQISFNNSLMPLPEGTITFKIPESSEPIFSKSHFPSRLASFYSQEPLIILYCDDNATPSFSTKIQALAKRFSQADFYGFPQLDLNLKILSLSDYQKNIPSFAHRLIIIGKHDSMVSFMREGTLHYPLEFSNNMTSILGIPQDLDSLPSETAYGLIFPIHQNGATLGLFLVAEDELGIKTLEDYYTQSTALLDENDLHIWSRNNNIFTHSFQTVFSYDWSTVSNSETILEAPSLSFQSWNIALQRSFLNISHHQAMITQSTTSRDLKLPDTMTKDLFTLYFPNDNFISLTMDNDSSKSILSYLLDNHPSSLDIQGLEPYLKIDSSSKKISFSPPENASPFKILIGNSLWKTIPSSLTQTASFSIFPFSSNEMAMNIFSSSCREFTDSLLLINGKQLTQNKE